MRKLTRLIICCGLLLVSCTSESSEEEMVSEITFKGVGPECTKDSTFLVTYNSKLSLLEIDITRSEYINADHPCWEIEMAIIQASDPYVDRWVTYTCPCYPDGDSDDLDTTIDNDPRVAIGTGN